MGCKTSAGDQRMTIICDIVRGVSTRAHFVTAAASGRRGDLRAPAARRRPSASPPRSTSTASSPAIQLDVFDALATVQAGSLR